ncbi:ABC transporter ATP-binding protein [Tsukamurella asaccharolytica]|uniref:ABC transporter ATP-binding protein n=1 Tax=Tsukamurella asaccharolytica TaxID=2592067 RepID=A0A5C5R8S6_9ACTN|nr:ABC transporter ATP-binding protein [Tsukamurella asaccharolytica]TWS18733.1 ABC transporter ATP-binding protein [Tsukamurella asaccharolytica]
MRVELSGVEVSLDGRRVLHNVTLAAPSGTWTAIVGPNGAGKSTLLRAVLGLVRSGGAIAIDGADPRRRSPRERARSMAYAPQSPLLPEGMTVFEYALLGRSPYIPYLGRESGTDRRIVRDVLGRLGLEEFAARDITHLSGGERQRAVLARALAQQAPLLLLDEPTTALDIGHQQQVMDLIDELRRADGLTVVTTIHDLTLAGQYADRLVLLADGRVAAAGAPREVLTADLIGEHFGARVHVHVGPDGRPLLGLLR